MFTSAIQTISELELIPEDLFYVTVNGKVVDWKSLDNGSHFQVHFRLRGGKGGFGSLLRSFRIHRSTNQLMCRDLSGRRLADIKEEEKLRKWIERAAEREEEKRRQNMFRQEKYEKLKAGPPKIDFNDPDFNQTREKIMEETDEAFEQVKIFDVSKNADLGIAAVKIRRNNGEGLMKSNQEESQVAEGDNSEEWTVPAKRTRTSGTSECVVPSNEEKSTAAVNDEGKKYVVNGDEKTLSTETAVAIAEKTNAPLEKTSNASSKMAICDINLDDYDSAEKLESLGLDCLKHALEVRGLKCGGSLAERAVRLYSVKNLKPEQYPKNIRARGKKEVLDSSNFPRLVAGFMMNHLPTGEDLSSQDLETNDSCDIDNKKDVTMNKNGTAEVSEVLAQVEQKAKEAVDVLMKVSEKSEKKILFPETDQLLHIQFVYKKPATTHTGDRVKRFILPHPLYEKGSTTVCLIMRDLDQSAKAKFDPDVDKQARLWTERLEHEFGVTKEHIQKVLTKRQLEREYHSYYDRRQLASAYDIFLVDAVVEKSVTRFCGKEFHKAKKTPLRLPIYRQKSLIKEIEKAYYTVTFPLSPFRTRTSLRIGNLGNPIDHIIENVHAAVENVFQCCPGGLCNIHSISLQMVTGGPSLPLYIDSGSRNAVSLPVPMKSKDLRAKRDRKAVCDDLSTLPEGLEVLVYGDGEVKVLDSNTKNPVLYPTIDDEWEARDDLKPLINPIKLQKSLERRHKLREKRKKTRKAQKQLLLPVKDGISKMKSLVKKKNDKRNKTGGFGDAKRTSNQVVISNKSRTVKMGSETKQKRI